MLKTLIALALLQVIVVDCGVQFDEQYLRLQGYQITGILEAKSKEECWKTALANLKTDCRGSDDRLVTWVSSVAFNILAVKAHNFHQQKRNAWRLLNCHQQDENKTVSVCSTSDWKEVRGCLGKLSENDCVVYALMIGLVGPACEYLKTDNGFVATITDTFNQVKESFTIEYKEDYNFVNIGKTFISNILPLYESQFRKSRFGFYLPWFILSYFRGNAFMCHYAVLEIIILAISRSFLGFIFPLMGITNQMLSLVLRYFTLAAQAYWCSMCYWKFVLKIILFIPQIFITLLDFIRSFGNDDRERDKNGRFTKR